MSFHVIYSPWPRNHKCRRFKCSVTPPLSHTQNVRNVVVLFHWIQLACQCNYSTNQLPNYINFLLLHGLHQGVALALPSYPLPAYRERSVIELNNVIRIKVFLMVILYIFHHRAIIWLRVFICYFLTVDELQILRVTLDTRDIDRNVPFGIMHSFRYAGSHHLWPSLFAHRWCCIWVKTRTRMGHAIRWIFDECVVSYS